MTRVGGPFVLLDDARPGGRSTLYTGLRELVETRDPTEIPDCLERLRGRKAAGFLAYEAGHGLETKLLPLARAPGADEPPLLWFGSFAEERTGDAADILPDAAGAWAGAACCAVTTVATIARAVAVTSRTSPAALKNRVNKKSAFMVNLRTLQKTARKPVD